MRLGIKRIFFTVCWLLGLFHLARALARTPPSIICYRAFAVDDEARFRPDVFISGKAFKARLELLARHGFSVVPLSEAVDGVKTRRKVVALTIDDSFHGVHATAAPILAGRKIPVTINVGFDEMQHQTPIFRLAIQYIFWKTDRLYLVGLNIPAVRGEAFNLRNRTSREQLIRRLIAYGESLPGDDEREAICDEVAEHLGLNYQEIKRSGILTPMTASELRELVATGLDVHSQRLASNGKTESLQERQDQPRKPKRGSVRGRRYHPIDLGSRGSTSYARRVDGTAQPGVAPFFDSENISTMEFRAEIFGFSALLHQLRNALFQGLPAWPRKPLPGIAVPHAVANPQQPPAKGAARVRSQAVKPSAKQGDAVMP